MKNQKIQNSFKTLFFRGNYGYLPTVIFFWFSIIYLVIMFLAEYYPIYNIILEFIYDIRNFAYVITFFLAWPIMMFISQDFLEKIKIIECGDICLPNPYFLLITSFIMIFIINLFAILILKLFKKK